MAKLQLDWSDGRYSTRLLTDNEVSKRDALDLDVVHLEDNIYETYLRHCDRDATWQVFWRSISNEQHIRRRQRELMPLEDAAREIDRLKEELARAQQMAKFFEDEWSQLRNRDADHLNNGSYTCVYPQPGCDIFALPAEWHHRALEILNEYEPAYAAEGMKMQGCCCGHRHRRLTVGEKADLRKAGFLIEDEAEVEAP